jgi:hypothetical protein
MIGCGSARLLRGGELGGGRGARDELLVGLLLFEWSGGAPLVGGAEAGMAALTTSSVHQKMSWSDLGQDGREQREGAQLAPVRRLLVVPHDRLVGHDLAPADGELLPVRAAGRLRREGAALSTRRGCRTCGRRARSRRRPRRRRKPPNGGGRRSKVRCAWPTLRCCPLPSRSVLDPPPPPPHTHTKDLRFPLKLPKRGPENSKTQSQARLQCTRDRTAGRRAQSFGPSQGLRALSLGRPLAPGAETSSPCALLLPVHSSHGSPR